MLKVLLSKTVRKIEWTGVGICPEVLGLVAGFAPDLAETFAFPATFS